MINNKYLILCIKGFGDAVLSCNFANQLMVDQYVIITSKKNEILVRGLLPSHSMVFTLEWLVSTFELFWLSNLTIDTPLRWIMIRRVLKAFNILGFTPLVDVNNTRNKLLFFGLNAQFPKINNVYQYYSNILGKDFYKPTKLEGLILIFPFGSQADRCMPKELILSILQVLSENNIPHKVVVHISEIEKLTNYYINHIIYENPNDLANLINRASLIISVDSFPLHMAVFKNKEIIVVTNSYDVFIPPILISENKIFQFDKIVESLKKIIVNKNI